MATRFGYTCSSARRSRLIEQDLAFGWCSKGWILAKRNPAKADTHSLIAPLIQGQVIVHGNRKPL